MASAKAYAHVLHDLSVDCEFQSLSTCQKVAYELSSLG